jgi:uncharacterized protein
MTWAVVSSVFFMALLGGAHCAAMCGGIVVAAEGAMVPRQPFPVQVVALPLPWVGRLIMHGGRLVTYTGLGALFGALGQTVWMQDVLPIQQYLFGFASLLLFSYGFMMLVRPAGQRWGIRWLEAPMGGFLEYLGISISKQARRIFPPRTLFQRFVLGLLWGLVPCGMVYGALSIALLAGNSQGGAVVMCAFGLGTLPNLLLLSTLSNQVMKWLQQRWVHIIAGVMVMGFGGWGLYRAIFLHQTLKHEGFCLI